MGLQPSRVAINLLVHQPFEELGEVPCETSYIGDKGYSLHYSLGQMVLMNVQCHRELCELDAVATRFLVKLIFGKKFYLDPNYVAASLLLQL